MPKNYLMTRKRSLSLSFTIDNEAGAPQFEAQGSFAVWSKLTMRDAQARQVATIRRRPLSRRYEIVADGEAATLRSNGVMGRRYEIDSARGRLEAVGNFSGRKYELTRNGARAAAVAQGKGLRARWAVEIQDWENPVLVLAAILVIESTTG